MPPFLQVCTTCASEADAIRIANSLVAQRLAACVQICGPLTSFYHWQGAIETSREWQCVVKTRSSLFAAVEAMIQANHTYTTPEIIAVPIVLCSAAYLAWLDAELVAAP